MKRLSRFASCAAALAWSLTLGAGRAPALNHERPQCVDTMIETRGSTTDHAAVAARYATMAKEAQAKAREHGFGASSYERNPLAGEGFVEPIAPGMRDARDRYLALEQAYAHLAKECDALAESHRRMAEE